MLGSYVDCKWANTQGRIKIDGKELACYACCYPVYLIPKPYFMAMHSTTSPYTNCPTWAPKEENDGKQ